MGGLDNFEQSSTPSSLDSSPYEPSKILHSLHLELEVVPNRPHLKHRESPTTKHLLSLVHDHRTEGPVPTSLRGDPKSPADPTRRRVSFARLGSGLISKDPQPDVKGPSWFDGDEFGLAGDPKSRSPNQFTHPNRSFLSTDPQRSSLDGRYSTSGHLSSVRPSQYADIERPLLFTTPPQSLKSLRRLSDPFPILRMSPSREITFPLLFVPSSEIMPVAEGVVSSTEVALPSSIFL